MCPELGGEVSGLCGAAPSVAAAGHRALGWPCPRSGSRLRGEGSGRRDGVPTLPSPPAGACTVGGFPGHGVGGPVPEDREPAGAPLLSPVTALGEERAFRKPYCLQQAP